MNFVSPFQPEREFKVYKSCKCSQIICSRLVNTNSKYKEDDFTDSIAANFSQDVCIHMIHFRHEAHTCSPHSFVPRLTLYTPQPAVRLGELS